MIKNANIRISYGALLISQGCSNMAVSILSLALIFIAVDVLQFSTEEVGYLKAGEKISFLVCGVFAGKLADTFSQKKIMIISDICCIFLISVFFGVFFPIVADIYIYVIFNFLFFSSIVFYDISHAAFVPRLFAKNELLYRNGQIHAFTKILAMGAAVLGGGVLSKVHHFWAMALVLSFLLISTISLYYLPNLKSNSTHVVTKEGMLAGFKNVISSDALSKLVLFGGISNLFSSMIETILYIYLSKNLSISVFGIGLIFTLRTLSSACIPIVVTKYTDKFQLKYLLFVISSVKGLVWIALGATTYMKSSVLVCLFLCFISAGEAVFNLTAMSFRQSVVPLETQGESLVAIRYFMWLTLPIGSLLGGWLNSIISIRQELLIIGIILVFAPLIILSIKDNIYIKSKV